MKLEHKTELIIQLDKVTISKINDSIFHVYYRENCLIDEKDFEINLNHYRSYSPDESLKILHEFGQGASVTFEARKYAQTVQVLAIAEAIVFSNLAQRLLVRFYEKTHKKRHPLRVFSTRDKAIAWLNSL